MRRLIYAISTKTNPSASVVGGKAKALIELAGAGFPVPKGIVLTTDFFSSWIEEIQRSTAWQDVVEEPDQAACNRVKDEVRNFVFSEKQQLAMREAMVLFSDCQCFAVRSSSAEEDLSGRSFAGMYESVLGVKREMLETEIRRVFASMLDYRVLSYKIQSGMDPYMLSMSVIIQEQIDSEVSGIGFSLNPKNNCYDEAVINASFGLGEAIVSGVVTPDSYVVDKVQKQILERDVNRKAVGFHLKKDGGVEKRKIERPDESCLTEGQIMELAGIIAACETHYGYPVDVEWAYADNQFYLLQVRPITSYVSLFPELMTQPGQRKKLYVDAIVVAQGFSEPLSVLGLDLWARVMDQIGAGFMPQGEGGYFLNLHGRQYFHVSNMMKGMGSKLGLLTVSNHARALKAQPDELVASYKAEKTTKEMWQARRAMVKMALVTIPIMVRGMVNPRKQGAFYKAVLESFFEKSKQISSLDFNQAMEVGFENLEPVMKYSTTYSIGALALSRLKRMFPGLDFQQDLASMQMLVPSNPTVAMGERQHELACLPELRKTGNAEAFIDRYGNREYSDHFLEKWETYLTRFGYRGFKEIDLASPRVKNHPERLFLQLKEIRIEDNQLRQAEAQKKEAVDRLRMESARRGTQKKFDKQLETYERLFGFREAPKDAVAFLMGSLHDAAITLGEEFVRADLLDTAQEIFDLNLQQIREVQINNQMDLRALREENLAPYRNAAQVKRWPTNIDSRGKIRYPECVVDKGGWKGEAISSGLVRGKAKILKTPYEKSIDAGEILVTVATEPAWTPIFINAAGVVMEIGGVLQHGAIIAREYGIPCVSGIQNATELIRDGDLIEVDGNHGTVRLIKSLKDE